MYYKTICMTFLCVCFSILFILTTYKVGRQVSGIPYCKTKTQKGQVICPRLHVSYMTRLYLK